VGLADEGGGEGLQLAQLPLGSGVDQLHRARELDVDLDTRLVHQFEAAGGCSRIGGQAVALFGERGDHAIAQCFAESALVVHGRRLQRLSQRELMRPLGARKTVVFRVVQQLQAAREHMLDQRRCQCQFIVDESLKYRSDRHGGTSRTKRFRLSSVPRCIRRAQKRLFLR